MEFNLEESHHEIGLPQILLQTGWHGNGQRWRSAAVGLSIFALRAATNGATPIKLTLSQCP